MWRFAPDFHREGERLGFQTETFDARLWREVGVPSCFEAGCPSLDGYEGVCWYRRAFSLPADWGTRRVVVRFEAVNYRAKVWLNGRFLGENRDGFLPFEFDISPTIRRPGSNLLAVAADNAHHEGDVPGNHTGWRGFGGILREVALIATDPLFVREARVLAAPNAKGGDASFTVRVANTSAAEASPAVELDILDPASQICGRFHAGPVALPAGAEHTFELGGHIPGAEPWSPAKPMLYTAAIRLREGDRLADEQTVSFGFRRIQTTTDGLLLNGQPIFLTGFNRHEDSPRTAMAPDPDLVRRDLEAMKEAGANMVRLCHYPHHPDTLALCDRLGLLVFAEVPLYFWNNAAEGKRTNEARCRTAARQLERLIARDYNHPSIVAWSVSNETREEVPEVAESNRRLIRHIRALDASRLCVHVSNRWVPHPNFDDDDVICINAYPSMRRQPDGSGPAADGGARSAAWWHTHLAALRAKYPGKPVLVTEFGYCSFAGTHGHAYGEDEHAQVIRAEFAALAESGVCGALIWCWADHPWPAGRFLGGLAMSPFGVLSRSRERLAPFHAARQLFRARQGLEQGVAQAAAGSTSVVMVRPNLAGIPEAPFPEGYGLRPMTPDDIGLWTDIQRDAEPYLNITDRTFRDEFGDDPGLLGRRCFIVTDPRGLGIGTISAWFNRDFHGEDYGRIHWVSVRPSAQGKGLGKAALAQALRVMAQWHDRCYLVTSIERVPAIRLYLAFGFQPDRRTPNAEANWAKFGL
jgi:beta-glucuronidase